MTTAGERLATVEAELRDMRKDVQAVLDLLNGGHDVTYERSMRGRLHKVEGTIAAMVLRRNFGVGMLKGWERAVLVCCGLATAAAAWYAALGQ